MTDHSTDHDSDLIAARMAKLAELRAAGSDPFAVERYERSHTAAEILEGFDGLEGQTVRVAGRVVSIREMGKASFAHLEDRTGRIQIYLKRDDLGDDYRLAHLMDLGDFLGVEGFVFRTRTGEVTIHVQTVCLLSKSLRPPPYGKQKGDEHWYGLHDVEQRYRQRYADLMVNPDVRAVFVTRAAIVAAIREFLNGRGFIEVETPTLQPIAGGATAKPFITHHNTLDTDLYLRIAPELYLKRLIVGGLERVYEIGKNFRNEGISTRHNPEFTMLETYQAYADYSDVMAMVEEMVSFAAQRALGRTTIAYQGREINLAPPWPRLNLFAAIRQFAGVDLEATTDEAEARKLAEGKGIDTSGIVGYGKIVDEVMKTRVVPNLIQPTFLVEYPVELSPLAKRDPQNPRLTHRFQPFIGRLEVGNAFSELNDPFDQRERFAAQLAQKAQGDEEAHAMDEDFLHALEYGLPPTGGLGIGIDRLVMLFTDQASIRDVVLFPQMKPEKGADAG